MQNRDAEVVVGRVPRCARDCGAEAVQCRAESAEEKEHGSRSLSSRSNTSAPYTATGELIAASSDTDRRLKETNSTMANSKKSERK